MQQIVRTERLGDGVSVVWKKDGEEMTSFFSFTRLIEMKVNVLDVLKTPGNYGIDEKTGKICFVAYCQPSWHQE